MRHAITTCCLVAACGPTRFTERESGEPCTWSAQCAGGICIPEAIDGKPTGWREGMCTEACPERKCGAETLACMDLDDGGLCMPRCGAEEPCRAGYVCNKEASACLPDCREGWACGEGRECGADGECRIKAWTSGGVGAPCAFAGDCASGICFAEKKEGTTTGWTGGMCADVCVAGACGEGATCVPLEDGAWCLPSCANGKTCREGYVCAPWLLACLPDCTKGWKCLPGYQCMGSGLCVPADTQGEAVGAPCKSAIDCASGVCFGEMKYGKPSGWTGGMCSQVCDAGACPVGTACAPLDGNAWCLPACGAGLPACRKGYRCDTDWGVCLPDCKMGWSCGDGYTCGADGLCQPAWKPTGKVGEPCSKPTDCASGACFAETDGGKPSGWTGGMCSDVCDAGTCPAGAACAPLGGDAWCLPACGNGLPACRKGYLCDADWDVCLPDCRLGWNCGDGYACGEDGSCQPAWKPTGKVGDPCAKPADCASGTCFAATDEGKPSGWTGGMCSDVCKGGQCGGGASCTPLGGQGWCLPDCGNGLPACRTGYVCSYDLHVCLPDCSKGWDCGPGYGCAPDGQCKPAPPPPGAIGQPCVTPQDCIGGLCFPEVEGGKPTGWVAGMCTRPCMGVPCPLGSACTSAKGGEFCLPVCTAMKPCRPGYVCDADKQVCRPNCVGGFWDCSPLTCSANGQCT